MMRSEKNPSAWIKATLFFCIVQAVSVSSSIQADTEPVDSLLIEDHHWNEQTKLWIARALVSEAGWEETTDHIAIAYVLFRRWRIARRAHPKVSLVAIIKKYCAGFGRTLPTPRQRWVRNLTADGSRPKDWPKDIRWRDYRERWMRVIEIVESWRQGRHPDPCNGLSRYWGGPMDRPSRRMIRMDCGPTKNRFYTVKIKLAN